MLLPKVPFGTKRDPDFARPIGDIRLPDNRGVDSNDDGKAADSAEKPPVRGTLTPLIPAFPIHTVNTAFPPPAPPPTPTPLTGYEVVTGPEVRVAPLSRGTAAAQCPSGKIAVGVGYRSKPERAQATDVPYGLEIKTAMPSGRDATVTLRNANVAEFAIFQPIGVCINPPATLRTVDIRQGVSSTESFGAVCGPDERLIGGGFEGQTEVHPKTYAPLAFRGEGGRWSLSAVKATPLPGQWSVHLRAFCAQSNFVPNWSVQVSSGIDLAARSAGTVTVSCPAGTQPLSGGIDGFFGSSDFAMLAPTFAPTLSNTGWEAQIFNRDLLGGPGSVLATAAMVCAQANR